MWTNAIRKALNRRMHFMAHPESVFLGTSTMHKIPSKKCAFSTGNFNFTIPTWPLK